MEATDLSVGYCSVVYGKLTLVDLAGSERVKKTGVTGLEIDDHIFLTFTFLPLSSLAGGVDFCSIFFLNSLVGKANISSGWVMDVTYVWYSRCSTE